jgi:hypothetical protein
MIEDTLRIITSDLGPFRSKDDFVEVTAHGPNHICFHTRFGNGGYLDVRADHDGEIRLFRNRRVGVPDEAPIVPEELPTYLNRLLERAQIQTAEFLAEQRVGPPPAKLLPSHTRP